MSELIQKNDSHATIRWKLLTGASALALMAQISAANAGDANKPELWIDFGGQLQQVEGLSSPFTAPFMFVQPTPPPYQGESFVAAQHGPRFSIGYDGKISFQPDGSDWVFSAGIQYGRSRSNKHNHHQTQIPPAELTFYFAYYHASYHISTTFRSQPFADTKAPFGEKHTVVDFQAGKDIGIGLFGHEGSSTLSAGIRFAQFRSNNSVDIRARPEVDTDVIYETLFSGYISFPVLHPNFHQYVLHGSAARSFRGMGPSLSWSASAAIAGTPQDGELTLDWGVNAALLFGRQKAKTEHDLKAYHHFYTVTGGYHFHHFYDLTSASANHSTRSRNVSVPNIGGFAGLSFRYIDAKVSVGYRVDSFFGAMDTGIDAAKKSNLSFNGPYASISIGLGD